MTRNGAEDSWVSFQSGRMCSPITDLNRIGMRAMSQGPGWLGLRLELGVADGWDGEDLSVSGHFVAMNTAAAALDIELRSGIDADWSRCRRLPGTFHIHPGGRPFWLRHRGQSQWAAAIIDRRFLDEIAGGHYELDAGTNIADPVLAHLFRALIEELLSPLTEHPQLREALVRNFTLALALRHGHPVRADESQGGLTQTQLDVLLGWLDMQLDQRISVSTMAARTGLSPSHFSREFRRLTGRTPWEYIVDARLQRAGRLLLRGETACAAAAQCGFFDQAHLSRLFKRRFGVSPSAYAQCTQRS